MGIILDTIQKMERDGYITKPNYPRCPVCGEETDTVYCGKDGSIVGCDRCVTLQDAWEVPP